MSDSISTGLFLASAVILLFLGSAHLFFTFFGTLLQPRDPHMMELMKRTYPSLTRQTNMWRAWIGFNASHSLGVLLFGLVYGYLALFHHAFLLGSSFLLTLGGVLLLIYCVLGHLYWFRVPFRGCVIAIVCYLSGVILGKL